MFSSFVGPLYFGRKLFSDYLVVAKAVIVAHGVGSSFELVSRINKLACAYSEDSNPSTLSNQSLTRVLKAYVSEYYEV